MNKPKITLVENKIMTFAEYLSTHPHLYDGIQLSGEEIETINRYFWDYNLKELSFSNHYLQHLSFYIPQYKRLKEIEFVEQIKDITTRKEILKIAQHVASTNTSDNTDNSTTINDIGQRVTNTDNKDANRALPMQTSGESTIEGLVDWSDGASGIGQSKSNNTQLAAQDKVSFGDIRHLQSLSDQWSTNDHDRTVIGDQAAVLINKIWNYIAKPKAMEWLCNKLEPSFLLVW